MAGLQLTEDDVAIRRGYSNGCMMTSFQLAGVTDEVTKNLNKLLLIIVLCQLFKNT